MQFIRNTCRASLPLPLHQRFLVIVTSSHKHLLHNLGGQFGTVEPFVGTFCVITGQSLRATSDRQLRY